ncbi:MAG: ABC transporter ATP-binding protein [Oscillospiraceae bacterium]|nr:ABC transporter ATP-binding protein [Oscillospiraceae bacterium]
MLKFRCENITKNYQGDPVIQDVTLSINSGQIVSLIGSSGVGKTTLFNVLSGLDLPDIGKVYLADEDITGQSGKVGYMQQKDLLLPYKTIIDNVSLPLMLKGESKKSARAKAEPFFATFGLEDTQKKYPHQLSGGMRQRAAFLRTYLFCDKIMLLDEPFSALDTITKRKMHKWFLDMKQKIGAGILFITHDIDEALRLSDKILIMSGVPGKITNAIEISPDLKRDDFELSLEYTQLKKQIIQNIL